MTLVDVILPLPINELFTYKFANSNNDNIQIGSRIIVQFGAKKYYTAIVTKVYQDDVSKSNIKEVISVLDKTPSVTILQLRFWNWMVSYYMCSMGDVYKAALPSALKLESETLVLRNPTFEPEENLTPTEQKIFNVLSEKKGLKINEIEKLSDVTRVIPHLKSLVDKNAIQLSENLRNSYIPKTETYISLAKETADHNLLETIDSLSKAKKQQHLLLTFLHLREVSQQMSGFSITKKELLQKANVTSNILEELVTKGIFKTLVQEVFRINYGENNTLKDKLLNSYQQKAYKQIKNSFNTKAVVLLHGVTSSGKTEIYINLIKEVIATGKQALYLLPEIALTTQITQRLKSVFGNQLAVYHSRFNDNERVETWNRILFDNECRVVLGARSSIFLPFQNLGLVIIDEEHENSYKQQDPAPRYNARDAAIMLANLHQAKTLLGTATPAVETYYNALSGRYGLVSLSERYDNIKLPHIIPVNTKDLKKRKLMKSILSPPLSDEMKTALAQNQQIILFQNRRGFAPLLECKTCSWTPKCEHCDVSLTYHKGQRLMVCHYCAATYSVPSICPDCKTDSMDILGYGTERIEEEVQEMFPNSSILRMDTDTTRSKKGYERIISDFENHKAEILIGTQMISKGLDFDNVNIVGILNADSLLNYPDFRAHERAFQLITQVSGRAGRKNKQGLVIIQTSHPAHPIITDIKNNDYENFYNTQIEERRLFRYPPFYRLISITIRAKDDKLLASMAEQLAISLRQALGDRVLGPSKPPISRIQSLFIQNILVKIESQASPEKVRQTIKQCVANIHNQQKYRNILLHYDIDPM